MGRNEPYAGNGEEKGKNEPLKPQRNVDPRQIPWGRRPRAASACRLRGHGLWPPKGVSGSAEANPPVGGVAGGLLSCPAPCPSNTTRAEAVAWHQLGGGQQGGTRCPSALPSTQPFSGPWQRCQLGVAPRYFQLHAWLRTQSRDIFAVRHQDRTPPGSATPQKPAPYRVLFLHQTSPRLTLLQPEVRGYRSTPIPLTQVQRNLCQLLRGQIDPSPPSLELALQELLREPSHPPQVEHVPAWGGPAQDPLLRICAAILPLPGAGGSR